MMADSSSTYQARVINDLIKGIKTPSFEEIIKEKLLSSGVELKKEEIDQHVSLKIALPLDESLSGAVSHALAKLQKDNIIVNTSHGYWKIC